ncbi:serine hydrolase [uncultured Polaribacter sp.]|uniref:serine hydrolase domain-containing protein n=1 Tax=uncultured Polaribacter sp. TaxID=174711 RepID=UPI0026336CCB|nr:serine hydrolase domain-containing protein [uncultured Polaribacter sp.]
MMKIKFTLLALLVSLLASAQKFDTEANRLMTDVFKENESGGIALVVKGGEVLYRKAFGMADMELDVKMTPENILRIGSITKQFTATAILKLMEEGKIDLQDDITKYIKDYPTQGHRITIEHLLTHTSGIKDITRMKTWTAELRRKHFTPIEKINFFKNEPMDFIPGEQFKYNNSGYIILGYIIEIVSGKKYSEYIDENFFKPLEMNNSFYESTSDIVKNRAKGYQKQEGKYKNANFLDMSNPYAAGSLISTVDDLYKWNNAVFNYKIVSKSTLDKAHSSYKLKNGELTGYGYGWDLNSIKNNKVILHGGAVSGYLAFSLYIPQKDIFVAVLSNCTCNRPRKTALKLAILALNQ